MLIRVQQVSGMNRQTPYLNRCILFDNMSVRVGYENDRQSPDPATPEADRLPSSILGQIDLSPQARAFVKEVWARQGYFDD